MFVSWICEAQRGKPIGDRRPRFPYVVLKQRPLEDDPGQTLFLLLETWSVLILTALSLAILTFAVLMVTVVGASWWMLLVAILWALAPWMGTLLSYLLSWRKVV